MQTTLGNNIALGVLLIKRIKRQSKLAKQKCSDIARGEKKEKYLKLINILSTKLQKKKKEIELDERIKNQHLRIDTRRRNI